MKQDVIEVILSNPDADFVNISGFFSVSDISLLIAIGNNDPDENSWLRSMCKKISRRRS